MSFKLPLVPNGNEYHLKNVLELQNAQFEHSQITMPRLTRCSETLGKRPCLWPSTRTARVMSGVQSVWLPVSGSVGSSS